METVDVVVIGLGTGGEDLALQLLDAGLEVVGIEPNLVGGECPYWACIPSKMAIRASNLLAEASRIEGVAGQAGVKPDWSHVASRIREEAAGNWDDSSAVTRFEERGGRLVRGFGRLDESGAVHAGGHVFAARKGVVVATGSRPNIPPIAGLGEVDYWTTHEAIAAESPPRSLIVLGGGPVGCELAQVFSRFGTEVAVLEGRPRILSREEPEASDVVARAFLDEGIGLHLGSRAREVRSRDNGIEVVLEDGSSLVAERLLVATGRASQVGQLGLENMGIDVSAGHIPVDGRMRATEGIWALGDVTGEAKFTHVALHQSAVVATDILGADPAPIDYQALPRVTFTDPEVGAVGLTEGEARKRGYEVAVAIKDVSSTFRGWLHDTGQTGIIKLVIDGNQDAIIGASVVGPAAGEVLGLLNLAVHERTPIPRLRAMTFPFPTFHGGIGEALGAYARGTGTVIDPDYKTSGYL